MTLQLEEQATQGVLLLFTLFILLSVPGWIFLSKRLGRKWPAAAGLASLGLLTAFTYIFFPAGSTAGPYGMAIAGGLAVGGILLFDSLMGDIAAREKRGTDQDWDGIYFGFWRMGQKMTRGIAAALSGTVFTLIGFQEGALTQTDEVARRLAWVFGPGVGAIFFSAAVVFAFFPRFAPEKPA